MTSDLADGLADIAGRAGAVRVSADAVTLALVDGAGRVGYKGRIVESVKPFEKRLPLASLSAQVEKSPAGDERIALPEWSAGATGDTIRTSKAADAVRYVLNSERAVMARAGDVRIEGRAAVIEVSPAGVRFCVPDGGYVHLIAGAVGVSGFGPFDLTFTPTGITGKVGGRMRTLVTTWPVGITRPMYRMDGRRWYAGWSDDPSIGKAPGGAQFSLAFAVFGGAHEVEIGEWQFPALPPVPERRSVTLE